MTAIRKTTAAIATAVLMGAGLAGPASADSAWVSDVELRQQGVIQGPQDPQPMKPGYFADGVPESAQPMSAQAIDAEGAYLSDLEARLSGKILGPQDPQPVNRAHFDTQGAGDIQQALAGGETAYPTGGNRR